MDVQVLTPNSELGQSAIAPPPEGWQSAGSLRLIQLLKDARETYRSHGGAKGWYVDSTTDQICVMGAIRQVLYGSPETSGPVLDTAPVQAAYTALCGVCPGSEIVDYNDLPSTTKEDVLRVFDHAIFFAEDADR